MKFKDKFRNIRSGNIRNPTNRLIRATRLLAAAIILQLSVGPAWAGPFSELVIFGDSLSDTGNIGDVSFGIVPSRFYYEDRFSNGPVYSELLATHLQLDPLLPSELGGTNYAYGGAQTSGSGVFAGFFIADVDDQVDEFLASGPIDPDALIVMFAGANDLFGGQTNPSIPVNNLVGDLNRLIASNAKNLLVMNLPPLGLTPRFNSNATVAASMNQLTNNFNALLSSALDTIETQNPTLDLFRLDVASIISEAVTDPGQFGLTNVTDPAAPGLDSGQILYNTNRIVDNPNEYLFWDEIHPTTTAHAELARQALNVIRNPADFNFDGQVNNADLLQWQQDYGLNGNSDADQDTDSDGADFLIWQQQFQLPSAPNAAIVPEPTTSLLLFSLLLTGLLPRRCYESRLFR